MAITPTRSTLKSILQVVLEGLEDADLQHARLLHQHGGGVALLAAQQAVLGGSGGDGRARAQLDRVAQAVDQVAEELRQVGATRRRRPAETEMILRLVADRLQPSSMVDWSDVRGCRPRFPPAAERLRVPCFSRSRMILTRLIRAQRLDQDLVGLLQDRRSGLLHLGKGAADEGDRLWIGVAHGADHGEAVAGLGHVQVADQRVEALRAPNSAISSRMRARRFSLELKSWSTRSAWVRMPRATRNLRKRSEKPRSSCITRTISSRVIRSAVQVVGGGGSGQPQAWDRRNRVFPNKVAGGQAG
jgi:hypothetical protein